MEGMVSCALKSDKLVFYRHTILMHKTLEGCMLDKLFWKGKKVLVTGHTGFKGSWLCEVLINLGAEVTGFAKEPETTPNLYTLLNLEKKVHSVIGDITTPGLFSGTYNAVNPDILFHLAAQPIVRKSYANPIETYNTNVMGTVNVLDAVRQNPCSRSVVNVTTDKVYLNQEWPWGYRETDTLCGFDPYSNSKSCSELVTYSYINSFFGSEDSPAISTARAGNVIGGGDFTEDRIIPDCVSAARVGEPIVLRNPNSVRPYQHVLECISGYLLLAQKQYMDKRRYAGSYNFGPEQSDCITTGELADLFCMEWGNGAHWISKGDDGPHEANYLKLDCSKAQKNLGWNPKWNIQKSISKTIDLYKAIIYNKDNINSVMDKQISGYYKGDY